MHGLLGALISLACVLYPAAAELDDNLKRLDWLIGVWKADYGGKVRWPTIPTMTYGEELIIQEAPIAKTTGIRMLNYTARSWSSSARDHLHDEWGYIAVNKSGFATLMTTGNNGFNKYEVGPIFHDSIELEMNDIYRIDHVRDRPVEAMKRTFKKHNDFVLEQTLQMRTDDIPNDRTPNRHRELRTHAQIYYNRVSSPTL